MAAATRKSFTFLLLLVMPGCFVLRSWRGGGGNPLEILRYFLYACSLEEFYPQKLIPKTGTCFKNWLHLL